MQIQGNVPQLIDGSVHPMQKMGDCVRTIWPPTASGLSGTVDRLGSTSQANGMHEKGRSHLRGMPLLHSWSFARRGSTVILAVDLATDLRGVGWPPLVRGQDTVYAVGIVVASKHVHGARPEDEYQIDSTEHLHQRIALLTRPSLSGSQTT